MPCENGHYDAFPNAVYSRPIRYDNVHPQDAVDMKGISTNETERFYSLKRGY